ncbi:hypothetical protein ACFWJM_29980 [Streptomyces sp. NPDC127077]|uniref:hypothetical protein n=1 Tax=Streptomyces sp. NPDC127077 TaxID=3347131 RepID=UPI003647D5B0
MRTADRSNLIDLVALTVVVTASVILVVCGDANASTIVIVGEFVAGILFAWFRLDGRNQDSRKKGPGASIQSQEPRGLSGGERSVEGPVSEAPESASGSRPSVTG